MDEDKTREETGEEWPTSPQHEARGEVDDRNDEKMVRYIYIVVT